jgi:hypothetical protein
MTRRTKKTTYVPTLARRLARVIPMPVTPVPKRFVIERRPLSLARALGSPNVLTRGLMESVTFKMTKKRAA